MQRAKLLIVNLDVHISKVFRPYKGLEPLATTLFPQHSSLPSFWQKLRRGRFGFSLSWIGVLHKFQDSLLLRRDHIWLSIEETFWPLSVNY